MATCIVLFKNITCQILSIKNVLEGFPSFVDVLSTSLFFLFKYQPREGSSFILVLSDACKSVTRSQLGCWIYNCGGSEGGIET